MQEDIRVILRGCIEARSDEERVANENKIRSIKESDPQGFLNEMTQQLNNADLPEGARHLTGILFKNTIKAGDEQPFWFSLSFEIREELKQRILAPLADESRSVRLSACSCVATVACLELPKNQWGDIIELLCTNSEAEDLKIRESSLITLGYICEEIEGEVLGKYNTNLVISALLQSLEKNKEFSNLMEISIEAVYHSIEFAESIFNQGEGGVIIKMILDHGFNESQDVRSKIMMCLAEIVRLYYSSIEEYMDNIHELTFKIIKEDIEEVATLGIEVW